jgi:hypothetical protein
MRGHVSLFTNVRGAWARVTVDQCSWGVGTCRFSPMFVGRGHVSLLTNADTWHSELVSTDHQRGDAGCHVREAWVGSWRKGPYYTNARTTPHTALRLNKKRRGPQAEKVTGLQQQLRRLEVA